MALAPPLHPKTSLCAPWQVFSKVQEAKGLCWEVTLVP